MIWGVLPCDIWTALRVHSLGKSDNSWKTTPLPSTLQLCRFGMTLLENLHHACLEKSIVLLSPSCGWAYAEKEKDSLACLPPPLLKQQVSLVAKSGGLVLSSSARVSHVTYQTVVGVRYPELVTFNGTSWNFGKFVIHDKPMRGGFLPVFWDVPRADTHAVEDIGAVVEWLTERCAFHADAKSSLAVLHNRNDMTNLFRASNWVSESKDSIVCRGVTTCAGMTAHTVILAQTRVGFLTGGRKKSFLDLPQDEQTVQLEEAYARATVAITRARALCLIMGPLDMKGLLGAATVMGTLMCRAGHVWAGRANFDLHDHELSRSPPDESFIDMLKQNCCLSGPHFPPPAIVEVLQDYVTNFHKVRRLHLIVVDLWRPWKYNTARAREITDQLWLIRDWGHPSSESFDQMALNLHWGAVDLHMAMLWMALSSRAI